MFLTLLGGAAYPLTLAWTGFWRANYTGSPWTGLPSAGASGGRLLSEGTNPATVGVVPQNGYDPASFDGTNDILATGVDFTSGEYLEDFVSGITSPWTVHVVVRCNSLVATGAWYLDPGIVSHSGSSVIGITASADGVQAHIYTSGGAVTTGLIPITTSDYHVVQARWDGTDLSLRVDGGTWDTVAAADMFYASDRALQLGCNYDRTAFLDADFLEFGIASSAFSNTELDDLYDYAVAEYALGGVSAISGTASLTLATGTSVLTGTGALVGSGTATLATGTSTLTGVGGLVGYAPIVLATGTSTLRGTGALVGSASATLATGTSTLTGSGALTGSASVTLATGTSALTGVAACVGSASLALTTGTSTLLGTGAMVGSAPLSLTTTGDLTDASSGFSYISGSATITLSASATLAAQGALVGSASLALATGTSTLRGTANAQGSATASLAASATATGTGALSGTAPVVLTCSATPRGTGALVGSSSLAVAATATGRMLAAIAGSVSFSLGANGTIVATGGLQGLALVALSTSGTLTGVASAAGTGTLTLGASALLGATVTASGSAALALSLTGTLGVVTEDVIPGGPYTTRLAGNFIGVTRPVSDERASTRIVASQVARTRRP